MPRGKTVKIGSVDSGQSIVRPARTASLLSFQRALVQAAASCGAARTMAPSVTKPQTALALDMAGPPDLK
jgi:hypothetical protein